MSLELALLSSHAPSLLYEDKVPDFQLSIVDAFHQQRAKNQSIKAGCPCSYIQPFSYELESLCGCYAVP